MYAFIEGQVVEKTNNTLVLLAGGVGYLLNCSMSTISAAPKTGEVMRCHTWLSVREDAMELFGFASKEEKQLFLLLTGVNGVGPKMALALLSTLSASDLRLAIIMEDDKTLAFLDINPETKGHTLVVPKNEVDKIYELPDEDFSALMATVKKLSKNMEEKLGKRTLWKVIGTDVPHTHVHLLAFDESWEHGKTLKLTPEEFEQIRQTLVIE